mmetsp:Transcript_87734/g.174130  ORF Transcript_87734/g.174130 Transcript_87734/m.174130 type:complete len:719 (+) Transcript_87734:32-2188(+)
MDIEVRTLAGNVLGKFLLDASASVLELKQLIAESDGPLPEFQKLICGETILRDEQPIVQVAAAASSDSQLLVNLAIPDFEIDPGSQIEVQWQVEAGSDDFLENLLFHKSSDDEQEWKYGKRGWTMSPDSSYDNSEVFCVGMDPNSGLLLLTHWDDWVGSRALLLPSVGAGYEVSVDGGDPLERAFEIHVMQEKSFSVPVGVAVALARKEDEEAFYDDIAGGPVLSSNASLINIIFAPGFLTTSSLCHDGDVQFEAVCLDRSVFPPRAICAERHADGKHHVNMRQCPGKVEELFPITSPGHSKRITSIVWVAAKTSSSVLFTVAGSHTISIYRNTGEGWQSVAVVGGSRGCQDGPLDQCLFWFPCPELRLLQHDSQPLITGQDGTVFVYSGGVLMKLASDLTSANKVASMRHELWLTEGDEGTPEFPTIHGAYGVYEGKIYRSILQSFGGGGWLIRRLQASALLRAPRQTIRRTAPKLWPNITEHKVFDRNDPDPEAAKPICGGREVSERPVKYNEEDRDRWDGDCRWIWDPYLWEGAEQPAKSEGKRGTDKGKGKISDKGDGKGKDAHEGKGKGGTTKGKGKGKGVDEGKGKGGTDKGRGKDEGKGKGKSKGKGKDKGKGADKGEGKGGTDKGKGKSKGADEAEVKGGTIKGISQGKDADKGNSKGGTDKGKGEGQGVGKGKEKGNREEKGKGKDRGKGKDKGKGTTKDRPRWRPKEA